MSTLEYYFFRFRTGATASTLKDLYLNLKRVSPKDFKHHQHQLSGWILSVLGLRHLSEDIDNIVKSSLPHDQIRKYVLHEIELSKQDFEDTSNDSEDDDDHCEDNHCEINQVKAADHKHDLIETDGIEIKPLDSWNVTDVIRIWTKDNLPSDISKVVDELDDVLLPKASEQKTEVNGEHETHKVENVESNSSSAPLKWVAFVPKTYRDKFPTIPWLDCEHFGNVMLTCQTYDAGNLYFAY